MLIDQVNESIDGGTKDVLPHREYTENWGADQDRPGDFDQTNACFAGAEPSGVWGNSCGLVLCAEGGAVSTNPSLQHCCGNSNPGQINFSSFCSMSQRCANGEPAKPGPGGQCFCSGDPAPGGGRGPRPAPSWEEWQQQWPQAVKNEINSLDEETVPEEFAPGEGLPGEDPLNPTNPGGF